MLNGVLCLLLCQLVGEVLVVSLHLPVPGPVIGMLILLVVLLARGQEVPGGLRGPSDALLRNLSFLFVPAGVGLILHLDLIAKEWLILLVALVVSSALTIVVTALVLRALVRRMER